LSFYPREQKPIVANPQWAGKDIRNFIKETNNYFLKVALLDVLYSVFVNKRKVSDITFSGNPKEKSEKYSQFVVDTLIKSFGKKLRSVVNVGTEGGFIRELQAHRLKVFATDKDPEVIGRMIEGVKVAPGNKTIELIAQTDLALVTGMTLATNTLSQIFAVCKKLNKKLVIFAETGHNLAEDYCRCGAAIVFSEPFPFFTLPGISEVRVFKR